jgi:hypothetical protein
LALVERRALETSQRSVPPLAGRGLTPSSELDDLFDDVTRPLLVGYVRRDLLSSDGAVEQLVAQMAVFARREGFSMGYTYVERAATSLAALEALVEFVGRTEDAAVVIPSPLHFLAIDGPINLREIFERATGTRVLMLTS